MCSENIYKPELMEIKEIIDETIDTKTFRLQFKDSETAKNFTFKAGQFGGTVCRLRNVGDGCGGVFHDRLMR